MLHDEGAIQRQQQVPHSKASLLDNGQPIPDLFILLAMASGSAAQAAVRAARMRPTMASLIHFCLQSITSLNMPQVCTSAPAHTCLHNSDPQCQNLHSSFSSSNERLPVMVVMLTGAANFQQVQSCKDIANEKRQDSVQGEGERMCVLGAVRLLEQGEQGMCQGGSSLSTQHATTHALQDGQCSEGHRPPRRCSCSAFLPLGTRQQGLVHLLLESLSEQMLQVSVTCPKDRPANACSLNRNGQAIHDHYEWHLAGGGRADTD